MKSKQVQDFKEIAELIKDQFIPTKNISMPYIGLEHIEQGTLRLSSIGKSSDITSQKFKFKKNDILFGKLRPYFRKVVRPSFDGICSTDIFVVRAKEGVSQIFLYYVMATNEFVNYSSQGSQGTKMPRASWDFLEKYEQWVPSLDEQERIGKTLDDLDSKIQNLQKQNQILEKTIQTIFKSWFIDFDGVTEFEDSELGKIPKGWQIGILENFLDLTKGVSYKSQDLKFSNKALVTLKSVKRGGGYTNIGLKSFDGKYNENQVVKENDIIVAQTDLTQNADVIGKPALIRDSKHFDILVASLDIVIIKIKNNKILKFYIYYLFLTDRFQNHVYGYTSGTTVLHLAKDAIPNFVFILPPTKTLEKFDKLISTWIQKNHENNNQIENLTKIRDFLLPKLMSGEIRV